MSSDINFNKHYVVYGHGVRDIKIKPEETIPESHFNLSPNYRVVTLHVPGKQIYNELVKIITNKISKKSVMINDLFFISCPLARKTCIEKLENELIMEYFSDQFSYNPENVNKMLNDIVNSYSDTDTDEEIELQSQDMNFNLTELNLINIHTLVELKTYLESNLKKIKKNLNFEIRLYRPSELCPKLRFDFTINNSLSMLKGGIFDVNTFENFDLDDYELIISTDKTKSLHSLVNFNNKYQYVFDEVDESVCKKSFFATIKKQVPTGTLIVLSCGDYSNGINNKCLQEKTLELVRSKSTSGQEAIFRKYKINYN